MTPGSQQALRRNAKRETALFIGSKLQVKRLLRNRNERFLPVNGLFAAKGGFHLSRFQLQAPRICTNIVSKLRKTQADTSRRQIGICVFSQEMLLRFPLRLLIPPGKSQISCPFVMREGSGQNRIPGIA